MILCEHTHICSEKKRIIFIKNGYQIVDCNTCGLRHAIIDSSIQEHISRIYDDSYFFGGGEGYPDYIKEKENLIRLGEFYAEKVGKHINTGTMFDIGAAAGFIMQGFLKKGWHVQGIEPNKTMVELGNRKKLNIFHGNFENFRSKNKFELITLIQVIGHFYDLHGVLKKLNDYLTTDGIVLVESWNMNSLYARILGKSWHEYSPPSVINWFSKSSLKKLFEMHGFEKIASGSPRKKINLSHGFSLFEYKYPHLSFGIKYMKKIIDDKQINVFYPPLDIFWSLFRRIK